MFDPQQLDETIYLSGVMMETNSDTLFEDLKTISKKYAKIKPQIKHLKKPVYTVVATSSKKLFMGDMTEKANKQMASLKIEKGQWIVKVPVKYHTQALLPAKVAERSFIKTGFHIRTLIKMMHGKIWKCIIIVRGVFERRQKWLWNFGFA